MDRIVKIAGGMLALALPLVAVACGGEDDGDDDASGIDQTPPQGEDNIKAWLATEEYKTWHCEADEHEARAPSPHGVNRICSNDIISENTAATFPEGAAAVKELWDGIDGSVMGYAVYLKVAADSAGGANWYWYEDNPEINPEGGVVADGLGSSGNAKDICVSCHVAAGSDENHEGYGDFVYTQVK